MAAVPASTVEEVNVDMSEVKVQTTDIPFREKLLQRSAGIVTFGMTPPRTSTSEEGLAKIVATTVQRLNTLPIDAIIVYDIHDEAERVKDQERVFPYSETHDGVKFMAPIVPLLPKSLSVVHYRCVVKHTAEEMEKFATTNKNDKNTNVVYVGGASSGDVLPLTLPQALAMHQKVAGDDFLVGAVAIPERHETKKTEHIRMIDKQIAGARFFVTQCVYSTELMKNLMSDYYYACKEKNMPMVPIIVTLAPVGGKKTFEFMRWLGVHTSKWLENDLNNSVEDADSSILEESVEALLNILRDLCHFCKRKGIPLGINVESIAIRKVEVDAALKLVSDAKRIMAEEMGIGAMPATAAALDALVA